MSDQYITDCGDGSCVLRDRSKPSGMHTNGGCQHLKRSGPEANAQLRALGAEIVRLRGGLAEAAARVRQRGLDTCAARQAHPSIGCAAWLERGMRCPGCPADEAEEYATIVDELKETT